MPDQTDHNGFSSSVCNQLDLICDEFDQMWADGKDPCIGDYLEEIDSEGRPRLLELLIPIDVEYRVRHGLTLVPEDYHQYGPGAESVVARAIRVQSRPESNTGNVDQLPVIKGYKIIRRIGQGGMGTVFLAEQREPVQRQVAIKVVRAGFDSSNVISRFEGERQALAMMDHPNIARIFDAGSTENGSPYFTMEWVQGESIASFCDNQQLEIKQRIELFLKVCQAVQHAHQKGIIHRDLKPSNVLVTNAGGEHVPKVIDFGLAKALEEQVRLTDQATLTCFGTIVGTPQYMSPEQAENDAAAVDTRSDIYSLGAILFELLTGTTPLDLSKIQMKTPSRALESVRQSSAPRPSSRLKSLDDLEVHISANRNLSIPRLRQLLRGELDWVALKALDRDRNRRYETVDAFQEDLRRYLNNDPVQARPPSTWYVLRKAAQKHKVLLSTAAIFVVLLMTTSLIITRLYFNERAASLSQEKSHSRAKYFSAIGFWARNRSDEAIKALSDIDARHRFIEYRLAKKQFLGNCFTIDKEDFDGHGFIAALSPDGTQIASVGNQSLLLIRDSKDGELIRKFGTVKQHDPVLSLSFHPSKNCVAVGFTAKLEIWNINTGIRINQFKFPGGPIRALQFSRDGKKIAAGGGRITDSTSPDLDSKISVWNLETGSDPVVLDGHKACVNSISFSFDSSTLVSCSHDKTIRIWDVVTGKEIQHVDIGSYVMSVAYDPTGEFLACGTGNNQLFMWRVGENGLEQLWIRNAHGYEGDSVDCLAFSPNGEKLATGSFDRTVKIWDVDVGKEQETLRGHVETVVRVGFGQDSNRLLSVSSDGVAKIWDLERQSESRVLKGHTQSVTAISFSSDSQWLLSACGEHEIDVDRAAPDNSRDRTIDNSIRLWNLHNNTSTSFKGHTNTVTDVEFDPTSRDGGLFVSCSADGSICFWDRKSRKLLGTIVDAHSGKPVNAIAFHPQGGKFVSVGDDSTVRIWDVESRTEMDSFSGHQHPVKSVAWNRSGTEIASLGRGPATGKIIVWNARSGSVQWSVDVKYVHSLSFSADGLFLVTSGLELIVYNTRTHQPVTSRKPSRLGLYFVNFYSKSGVPRLLTGGREGKIWLWDCETWEELSEFEVKGVSNWSFVYDGKFSPDGRMIATANRDGTIRIWDAPYDDDLDE